MNAPFKLSNNPDWHSAAQDLVNGLQALSEVEERISLLQEICDQLGDELYPAFLQILFALEQFSDESARALVASTLVDCIRSGRLPSGKLSAWGSNSMTGDSAFGQTRVLGPVEYVCAWYAQGGTLQPLSQQQFRLVATSLLNLVGSDAKAKDFYCKKLHGDIHDPISGALSNRTRQAIEELIQVWQQTSNIDDAVDTFVSSLQSESVLNQISKGPLDSLF